VQNVTIPRSRNCNILVDVGHPEDVRHQNIHSYPYTPVGSVKKMNTVLNKIFTSSHSDWCST